MCVCVRLLVCVYTVVLKEIVSHFVNYSHYWLKYLKMSHFDSSNKINFDNELIINNDLLNVRIWGLECCSDKSSNMKTSPWSQGNIKGHFHNV